MSPERPEVLGADRLANSFLGQVVEICIATRDHRRTMEGLVRLGIGPWRVYTFDADSVSERTYGGEPADWAMKVCFAEATNVVWEIMEPLRGPTIVGDFLDAHGEGVHHVAFDCEGRAWETRASAFAERGFARTQSGVFAGGNAFSFFGTEEATGTTFETYFFPPDFTWPAPEAWFPSPPPGADDDNSKKEPHA